MKLMLLFALLALAFVRPVQAAPSVDASCSVLTPQVQSLLSAYSSKNLTAVMKLTDTGQVLVLGTHVTEIADTPQKVRELLAGDFALWTSSEFGSPKFMSCRVSHGLATAAFDAPFTMRRSDGHSDTMAIRFLTVWHKVRGRWLLTQSLNSVPTTGQAAAETRKQSAKSI